MAMTFVQTTAVFLDRLDEDHAVALLRNVRAGDLSPAPEEIGELLDTTPSHRLRNAAALALVEMGATEAASRVAALLGRPEIARQGGTLLFALDELGGLLPLESLVNVVNHGSYEARAEALVFVEEGRLAATTIAAREEARQQLRLLAQSHDRDAAEAARIALDGLGVVQLELERGDGV